MEPQKTVVDNGAAAPPTEDADSSVPLEVNLSSADASASDNKRKRTQKRPRCEDPHAAAYRTVTFTPIPSTGRPGTPHSFFQESYAVGWKNYTDSTSADPAVSQQVVHTHPNGLAIVTAGNSWNHGSVSSVNFEVLASDVQNAGMRRKKQSKMMHNKVVEGVVRPDTVLARASVVKPNDGNGDDPKNTSTTTIPILSCVWGAVVEINPQLTANPGLLAKDPLLDGYLAVVLPTGPFPPQALADQKEEESK